ncbi:MAG TPA: TPM domain-containing protein [Nitrospirae bacterium]|nr:TPM domain-containing protein [Nitrospirota bacterium]
MRLKNKALILLLFMFLCLFAVTTSAEVSLPDRPSNYVVDLAGIINDNVESDLNRYLMELEQKTTAQMVVLTIQSLEGESLEDLSLQIAHDKWKLGQKGKDNGVLLLVSLQDRKYRFEIGYGLEGVLPDSFVGQIGRDYLVPYFREGDYSKGIFTASLAVVSTISSDAGVEITGMPKLRASSRYGSRQRGKPSILSTIFSILFFIGLIYLFIKHPRLLLLLFMFSMMGGGRRSGWGGGGGFSGGGGGFGGGGASGGW